MTPSGHKAFLVSNVKDVELLLMHNKTYAAEYVCPPIPPRQRKIHGTYVFPVGEDDAGACD